MVDRPDQWGYKGLAGEMDINPSWEQRLKELFWGVQAPQHDPLRAAAGPEASAYANAHANDAWGESFFNSPALMENERLRNTPMGKANIDAAKREYSTRPEVLEAKIRQMSELKQSNPTYFEAQYGVPNPEEYYQFDNPGAVDAAMLRGDEMMADILPTDPMLPAPDNTAWDDLENLPGNRVEELQNRLWSDEEIY